MKPTTVIAAVSALIGIGIGASIPRAVAQEPTPPRQPGFSDLVTLVRTSPGCLGAEAVAVAGKKQVAILAWFKDKKALQDWYQSRMHQGMMKRFFPDFKSNREALSLIKDPSKPVMVIASVTPSETGAFSQIAIELYTPVPGGLAVGGTLSPKTLEVEGLLRSNPGG